MKRAIVVGVRGAGNDLRSINAPGFGFRDEETVSEAPLEHVHRHEPVDVNHPSSLGGSPIGGGVANCRVCGY